MFRPDVSYIDPDSHFLEAPVSLAGSEFAGTLYERTDGGFDLYLFHEGSDYEGLDIAKVTRLRHMAAPDSHIFIASFPADLKNSALISAAKSRLTDWLHSTLNI